MLGISSKTVILSTIALVGCRSEPTAYNFRTLTIAPDGHFLRSQILTDPPEATSYYTYFSGAYIDMLSHLVSLKGQPPQPVLNYTSDRDRKLLQTLRIEPISTGVYGTISLQKECFFKPEYRSEISIRPYLDDIRLLAAPQHLSGLPSSSVPLTEVSLIRVTQSRSNYLIAGVTYEASGRARGFVQIEVKPGGEQVSASTLSSNFPLERMLAQLGLPEELNVVDYQSTHRIYLPPASNPNVQTLLVLRYGFDTWLEADSLVNGERRSFEYLQPYVASEDELLNERCDENLKRQKASGGSTAG